MTKDEKPFWWPELIDEKFFARIRSDYSEESAGLTNDSLRDKYDAHGKYSDVWDHLGDAREDWEGLADAFLEQSERIAHLEAALVKADAMRKTRGCGSVAAYEYDQARAATRTREEGAPSDDEGRES